MRKTLLITTILLISFSSYSQFSDTTYNRRWLDIDTTIFKQSLTRTALDKVNNIYLLAKKESKPVQMIKSLLYRMYLEQNIYEDNFKRSIDLLKKEITETSDVAIKSVLMSLLAEKYQRYYEQQRYQIYNRTKTTDYKQDDIATWTIEDLHKVITHWYQQSLLQKDILQTQAVEKYDAILNLYSKNYYRPTLYDLLAHRALGYFKNDNTYLTKPEYAFIINQPQALGDIETFINYNFATKDSASNKWKALMLYQDLIRFHQQQKDTAALIDVNLARIQYAKNAGSFDNEDSLYYAAIKETAERFKGNRFAAEAFYLLAQYHANKAGSFSYNKSDSSIRWEYVKALEIIKPFLPIKDSTIGHNHLFNLYHQIISKSISLQTEEVNVPGKPFKMLVNFKNADTLYYRIIRSTQAVEDSISKHSVYRYANQKSLFDIAKDFPYLSQQNAKLPLAKDYQQHSVELKVDALPVGEYYILASVTQAFTDTANLAWHHIYVSNISYVNNGPNYFVLNRTTGKPLAKATVQVYEYKYNSKTSRGEYVKGESYITNSNGYTKINIGKNNNRNIQLEITHGGDRLYLKNSQYINKLTYNSNDDRDDYDDDEEYEEDHAKVFYFTDRSIYRPGQKVYFKMIMLTKDRKTGNTKVFKPATEDSIYVYLNDANEQEIDSLLVKVNEYGSFAGSFMLPTNTLTGEFSLQLDDDFDGETGGRFSVEEYKRPTFEVSLEKPKGEYKLGDSLTITGNAKAYAGNATDGATVKYTVKRTGRFIYPWLYRGFYPRSSETVITFGETKTDAEGKFTIGFMAKPDPEVSKKTLPIFDYVIEANVTDNAGETRSNTITASAGYHSLNISMTVKATEDADSLRNIFVSTTNIGGDKQPANVTVSVIPLQSPNELLRKKYWSQPDTFMYSKAQYKQWFPNDEYKNESDKETWSRLAPVFTTTINTGDTDRAVIPKGKLFAGWYLVQAVTLDKQGNEIKDEKYVQLYTRKAGQFNGNNYLFTSLINNYVQPGEAAQFLLGSNAEDVFLIQEIQHKPPKKKTEIQTEYRFHTLNKNVKTIQVMPGKDDEGGMGVNFVMVKDNRMYTWNQRVDVQKQEADLNVEVVTYRNKLEPGSNEQWTVKISGPNKDAAAAEVLTSMYDASLDQFKPHGWSKPLLSEERFYSNGWDNNEGFSGATSNQNYVQLPSRQTWAVYPEIEFNRQARFDIGTIQLQKSSSLENVVVTGYSQELRFNMNGSPGAAGDVMIRGGRSISNTNAPLYIVNGVPVSSLEGIDEGFISSMDVLKDATATALYGSRGANGVIIITTKGATEKEEEVSIKVRTNFNETAFFFPQLHTDAEGNVSFTFTLPEALTQWKWQVLAHNKSANFGYLKRTIVSQKTLMVQMNVPRFLRQGDAITLTAKVSNLSDGELKGKATLQLFNAATNEPVDMVFANATTEQSFTAPSKQSTSVSFSIKVPDDFIQPLTWRIVAKAGSYGDGEENTIPVLSKKMLVTESLPLFVRGDGKKTFEFTKLLNNTSNTLQHQSLTIEYTSEPVWYAIQSLPYLIEYPYECAEQTFNRLFANALAAKIANSHPRIKAVFDEWLKIDSATGKGSDMMLSNLQKNQELKNVLLQETPWVLQAESEAQQKKNIAILFDVMKMAKSSKEFLEKLKQSQMESGGFAWFKGGYEDRYITQYILTGIGRLKKMNAVPDNIKEELDAIAGRALKFIDAANIKDYEELLNRKADLKTQQISSINIQYLYMRSLYNMKEYPVKDMRAISFYTTQAKQYWNKQSTYFKAMTGAALYNTNDKAFVSQNILPALLENAVIDDDSAMYWKDMQRGWYWYQAPVEQQVMIMELVDDVYKDKQTASLLARINDMKTWLLKQKQTNHWSNTKSTADACYVLVLTGDNPLAKERKVTITAGDYVVSTASSKAEAGSGYIKEKIEGSKITPSMGNITITTNTQISQLTNKPINGSTPSWGAVYWQYFEEMDKITSAASPLSVEKNLFIEVNTATGKELQQVKNGDALKVGDKLKVRIVLRSDRDMEYIHLKDMRAAGSEPVNVLSSYKWQDGLGYYESTRDAATNFFISNLPRGTYVFEYPLYVTHSGNFSVGIATAQCMYAPEFSSHSEGIRVNVK